MQPQPRTGVVLAGGYSTRFGETDKALAEVNGTAMIARVVSRLTGVVDRIVVSCRERQQPVFERVLSALDTDVPVQFALDPTPDRGPLAGLVSGFEQVETTYAAVVACDMPFVDPAFIAFLFEQVGGHDAAVPEVDDGHRQPTQAVYHVGRTATVGDRRLAADELSLRGMLSELDTLILPAATVSAHTNRRSLRDINSHAELVHETVDDNSPQDHQ
jgi:molybdopterin-guanine dinucleotide biosynthesis protein A